MFEDLNGHKSTYELGHSFRHLDARNGPTVPLQNELELYNAVHKVVIEDEIFYSSEVYNKVIGILGDKVSSEELAVNTDRVERGNFGMIIFYMKDFVKNNAIFFSNLEAIKDPRIVVGLTIKNTSINAIKFSNIKVTEVNLKTGFVSVTCSRRGTSVKKYYIIGANSHYIQDHLKGLEFPTGITVSKGDGFTTTTIDISAAHRASLKYKAA